MYKHSSKTYWTALFSRTGYELSEIVGRLKIKPNRIICNKSVLQSVTSYELDKLIEEEAIELVRVNKIPSVEEYNGMFQNNTKQIITLHGWMRVIPPEICDKYEIYNGHPGLITKYPELKGKDPQIRAFEAGHLDIGTVIHRVIPEVDAGKILASSSIDNTCTDVDMMFDVLREMSIGLWCDVLVDKL